MDHLLVKSLAAESVLELYYSISRTSMLCPVLLSKGCHFPHVEEYYKYKETRDVYYSDFR